MKIKKSYPLLIVTIFFAQLIWGQNSETQNSKSNQTTLSRSGLFIEPSIFYSTEDSSIRTSQLPILNDDTSGNTTGYGLGLRFGGHVAEILLVGVDARYAKMKNDDSFYRDVDAAVYNIAPMIVLQTPFFGVRLLGSYIVYGENDPSNGSQGIDLKFTEVTGPRLGAGIYVGPISLNLEYQDLKYNKTEIESYGSFAVNNTTDVDTTTKGYILSLSFPIEL